MNPNECQHYELYDDDDGAVYCNDCGLCLAIPCDRCAGSGEIAEDDYEQDSINFGHVRMMCPQCNGSGYLA